MTRPLPPLPYTPFIDTIDSDMGGRVDIVGDVHGCFDELVILLRQMGWIVGAASDGQCDPITLAHPEGRRLVLVGDLTDRGPASDKVLRLAMTGRSSGVIHTVMGNHDWKILRYLCGRPVKLSSSAQVTIDQIQALGDKFTDAVLSFYTNTPHQIRVSLPPDHPYADAGCMTVVHGAARAHRQDKSDRDTFERSIFGYKSGNTDSDGAPIRIDWAETYDGIRPVVHGHTPRYRPRDLNRVICIDTGCVFGNTLTAYRVDTATTVSVPALANHSGKIKTLLP